MSESKGLSLEVRTIAYLLILLSQFFFFFCTDVVGEETIHMKAVVFLLHSTKFKANLNGFIIFFFPTHNKLVTYNSCRDIFLFLFFVAACSRSWMARKLKCDLPNLTAQQNKNHQQVEKKKEKTCHIGFAE